VAALAGGSAAREVDRGAAGEPRGRLAGARAAHAVEIAAAADGSVLGLRARVVSDGGAYHAYPTTGALDHWAPRTSPGPYCTPAYEYEAIALATHKPPLGAYRGVGMTRARSSWSGCSISSRDAAALDPAEVRRRNLIPREAYPFTSASARCTTAANSRRPLEQTLAAVDYDALRVAQRSARAAGRLVGIGIGSTRNTRDGSAVFRRRGMNDVPGIEAATVTVDLDATVPVLRRFPTQGQGHATHDRPGRRRSAWRRPGERSREPVDTARSPRGSGTFGSRAPSRCSPAAGAAADVVAAKLRSLAAHRLEASAADVVLEAGRAWVRGFRSHDPARRDRAARVRAAARRPADGVPPGLDATVYFDPPGPTFSVPSTSRWSRSTPRPGASPSSGTPSRRTAAP